jgi:hypothetical protein
MLERYVSFWEKPFLRRVQPNNKSRESPSLHIGITPSKKGKLEHFAMDLTEPSGNQIPFFGNCAQSPRFRV